MSGSRPSRIASTQPDARRRQSVANSCSLAIRAARRDEDPLAAISEHASTSFAAAEVARRSANDVSLAFGVGIFARDIAVIGGRCAALIASHAEAAPGMW